MSKVPYPTSRITHLPGEGSLPHPLPQRAPSNRFASASPSDPLMTGLSPRQCHDVLPRTHESLSRSVKLTNNRCPLPDWGEVPTAAARSGRLQWSCVDSRRAMIESGRTVPANVTGMTRAPPFQERIVASSSSDTLASNGAPEAVPHAIPALSGSGDCHPAPLDPSGGRKAPGAIPAMTNEHKGVTGDRESRTHEQDRDLPSSAVATKPASAGYFPAALKEDQMDSGEDFAKLATKAHAQPTISENYTIALRETQMEAFRAQMKASRGRQSLDMIVDNYRDAIRGMQIESSKEIHRLEAKVSQQTAILDNYVEAIREAQMMKRNEIDQILMTMRGLLRTIKNAVVAGDEVDWLTPFSAVGASSDAMVEEGGGSNGSLDNGVTINIKENKVAFPLREPTDIGEKGSRETFGKRRAESGFDKEAGTSHVSGVGDPRILHVYEVHARQMGHMMDVHSKQLQALREDVSSLRQSIVASDTPSATVAAASIPHQPVEHLRQQLEQLKLLNIKAEASKRAEIMNATNRLKASHAKELTALKEKNVALVEEMVKLKGGLAEDRAVARVVPGFSVGTEHEDAKDWCPRVFRQ